MRLCRYLYRREVSIGFYDEHGVVPLARAAEIHAEISGTSLKIDADDDLLRFLPPAGDQLDLARTLDRWVASQASTELDAYRLDHSNIEILVPIPRPSKLLLLAGNYASHIEECGGTAAERAETFPYVFMKPPTTTLTASGQPVKIPSVSPDYIDWELELAVVIGRVCKGVSESEALSYVAGYTVVNDVSDRKFRPNPNRKRRERDQFFDWLHGKWHDSCCPCGPCITSADSIPDPQSLPMQLRVNGQLRQDASTAQQIFPVAAVIEFISSFVTLEPGDIISTGTSAGVGNTSRTYLNAGDVVEAFIGSIGTLRSPIE